MDGLTSDVAFVKANMQDKLKDKVRRNNNLVVEIQGAVIITRNNMFKFFLKSLIIFSLFYSVSHAGTGRSNRI